MEAPSKENTLYLPIKQVYIDQIIEGTKKIEYREVREGNTAGRYLIKDSATKYRLNPDVVKDFSKEYFVDGKLPFLPRPYKYLELVVGYAKERDRAIVEVVNFSFHPKPLGKMPRAFPVLPSGLRNSILEKL